MPRRPAIPEPQAQAAQFLRECRGEHLALQLQPELRQVMTEVKRKCRIGIPSQTREPCPNRVRRLRHMRAVVIGILHTQCIKMLDVGRSSLAGWKPTVLHRDLRSLLQVGHRQCLRQPHPQLRVELPRLRPQPRGLHLLQLHLQDEVWCLAQLLLQPQEIRNQRPQAPQIQENPRLGTGGTPSLIAAEPKALLQEEETTMDPFCF
mmetsp:Transcript_22245/g.50779  ORF Transcript_22245/g.50779 Transcript_22245/m.50779 type:complete len:205 (-) Transcript_22245:17-631(-)